MMLLRHANIVGTGHDADINGRGAALRILPKNATSMSSSLQDILLNTGRTFGTATAKEFLEFTASAIEHKSDMLKGGSLSKQSINETLRIPNSYAELYYHSQICYQWIDQAGKSRYARFRLLNSLKKAEGGIPAESLEPGQKGAELTPFKSQCTDTGTFEPGPRLSVPRAEEEKRSSDYLRKEFKERIQSETVSYLLQVQFRSEENDALNCSVPWDSEIYPWLDLAKIELSEVLDENSEANNLEFNPANTHPMLKLPLAKDSEDFASLGHIRALVYHYCARVRREETLYFYNNVGVLPGVPNYYTLPSSELPSRHYVFLRSSLLPNISAALPLPGLIGDFATKTRDILDFMPTTRTRLEIGQNGNVGDLSDSFFVERRLNGYHPGAVREISGQGWSHAISFDLHKYSLKPGLSFPQKLECRFLNEDGLFLPHSIKIDGNESKPSDGEKWALAKKVFLQAEFVMQELQLHLGRCHINMEQYAIAFFRTINATNPLSAFLRPHFEGLIFINAVGVPQIVGDSGFITLASSLTEKSIDSIMLSELEKLSHMWDPRDNLPSKDIPGDKFSPAVRKIWSILDEYVERDFFEKFKNEIANETNSKEFDEFMAELQRHSVYAGEAASFSRSELKRLLMYILYHCMFLHSWVNFKQYDDAGDPSIVTMGDYEQFGTTTAEKLRVLQQSLTWILSSVRYKPVLRHGPDLLKKLLQENENIFSPNLPLGDIMMSINI